MVDFDFKEKYSIDDLVQIIRLLRGEGGCPWDMQQTHQSIRNNVIEEAYEVADAVDTDDKAALCEELGDLLMQIVMHAEIAKLHGEFDITGATTAICEKMIQRHTHIFGNDSAQTPDSVLDLWARNKMKERGQTTYTETLREVNRSLPALLRGRKIMGKAAGAGCVVQDAAALAEEAAEAMRHVAPGADSEELLGNALLLVCALSKVLGVDPELALNEAADRFVDRFEALETELTDGGEALPAAAERTAEYWERVKLRKNV